MWDLGCGGMSRSPLEMHAQPVADHLSPSDVPLLTRNRVLVVLL
jgi:hypothetical protein